MTTLALAELDYRESVDTPPICEKHGIPKVRHTYRGKARGWDCRICLREQAHERRRRDGVAPLWSPEHRAKLSESHMGRVFTPETRAKISAAKMGNRNRLGCKNTPEHRAKISAALTRDNVGYDAVHWRLRRRYPKTGTCDLCGVSDGRPTEWAYFGNDPRRFESDLSKYIEAHAGCHQRMDKFENKIRSFGIDVVHE